MKQENLKTPETAIEPSYLFDCFLPYRDALHLERWVSSLFKLQELLEANIPIQENYVYGAHHTAHCFFPDLRSPYYSEEEWKDVRKKELEFAAMTEEEKNQKIEEDSERIREQVESGEIDIWDDTPQYVDRNEVQKFVNQCIELLKTKFLKALNPKVSYIEKLLKEAINYLENFSHNDPQERRKTRKGLRATLHLWDVAKTYNEGEPPYRIVFSEQVAEALGIDATLESAKLQKLEPLGGSSLKRLIAAYNVSKKFRNSQEMPILDKLFESIEKKPQKRKGLMRKNKPLSLD